MDIKTILKLQDACINGNLPTVQKIIKSGFDINQVLDEGKTALCWSASNGHLEVSKLLIDNGAAINFQEEDEGESILIFVIQEVEGETLKAMVKLLIENGANIDLPDFLGWTPLIHAIDYDSISLVELLLSYNANPNLPNKENSAITKCKNETIKKLLITNTNK